MPKQDDTATLVRAIAFAADKHRDHRRKDEHASPYINHPIALADILVNEAGVTDIQTLCAAILHDTIEDTETSAGELEEVFGGEIAGIVLEVSDDKSLDKQERKRLQIEHAAHASSKARLVKLADKISNLRDVHSSPPTSWGLERKREYFDWARQVIDQLKGTDSTLETLFDAAYRNKPA